MALTKVSGYRAVPGASISQSLAITGDTSYVTGGYVLFPADFGFTVLRRITAAFFSTVAGAAYELAVVPTYNADGITLASIAVALIVGTTGAQVAAAANVSTVGIQLIAEGN